MTTQMIRPDHTDNHDQEAQTMSETTTRPSPETRAGIARSRPAWLVVAIREFGVKLRDKGFLISTLATVALMAGALVVQGLVSSGDEEISVAVTGTGGTGLVSSADALADEADVAFKGDDLASVAEVEAAVRDGSADVGLVPDGDGWRIVAKTDRNKPAEQWIGAAVQQQVVAANAEAAGTSMEELAAGATVDHELLAPDDTPEGVARASTFVFGFLFYLAAILLGVSLATSIVEEKQNRVVEIIASSLRLRDLLIGKIAGITAIGLGQMVLFAVAGVIGLAAIDKTDTLEQIVPGIGWFLVFFLVGIVALSTVYAAAGALSSRTEDIQSTTTPITMAVAVVFIAAITLKDTGATVLSFVPISSTIAMPARVVSGDASWWEPIVALGISVVASALVVALAERIYRRALMQTGGRLSMRQALKIQD